MTVEELLVRPALELADLVRRKDVSPVELVEATLARIADVDGALNSLATVDADVALEAARRAEAAAGSDEAPTFHGVPIAIKDLHLTAGLRTTFGCSKFAEFVPPIDDESVRRLKLAGFVVIGKTNVPEFGTVPVTESALLGPCRNPWDLGRTPGGSSGGAAAAVAAGIVPVADGSDGGGSIRIPASNCGLFGLKPGRGRISNAPLFGDRGSGLVTPGPITRFVDDAAAMLDAMAGYAPGDPHWAPPPERRFLDEARTDPGRLRLGLLAAPPSAAYDPGCVAAAEDAGRLLAGLGHDVEAVTLPLDEGFFADFGVLWAANVAALPVDPAALEPANALLHERGSAESAGAFVRALTSLQRQSRAIVGASLPFDAIVAPTLARPPLLIGETAQLDGEERFAAHAAYVGLTPVANVTGQPAMNLPLGWSPDGLPLGVMVTGRPADEATLLRLAGQVQAATGWPGRRPRLTASSAEG